MELATEQTRELPLIGLLSEEKYEIINFKKGQLIYCEGNTPLGVFLVKVGKIKVSKSGSSGKEQIIRIIKPGEFINFSELITNIKFRSTAKALENSVLFFIERETFKKYLKNSTSISEQFIIHLSKELLKAEERMAGLSYKQVRARVAEALIELTGADAYSVNISRKDLACFIGAAKETLNRIISELRKEGVVTIAKSTIKIENRPQLIVYSNN